MVQSRKQFFTVSTIFILLVSICLAAIVLNAGTLTNNKKSEPSPSATPSPSPEPTQTATPNPTGNPSATDTPAQTSTPTPTSTPEATNPPTATPTPTAKPTETPIPSPSAMPALDPALAIFSDRFQSGNMSAWTSTDTSGVNLSVKNGLLQCQTQTSTNGSWGYLYKWLDQNYTSIYWRWYVYFGNLPATDGNVIGAGGIYNSAVEKNFNPSYTVCSLAAICENGAYHWQLRFTNASQFCSSTATQTVQANTWYLVELKAVQGAGNGEVHFYLDNAEILNATGLTNNHNAGIDHVSIGGGITADQPITWYCGGVVAAQTYVGPEPSASSVATATFPALTSLAVIIIAGLSCLSVPALFTIFRTQKLGLGRKKQPSL